MLSFVSLGVLGEYAKSLFSSSPYMQRFFLRIMCVRLNFCVPKTTWNSPCTLYTSKCFLHILPIRLIFSCILYSRLNTFRVFSEYAERMKHMNAFKENTHNGDKRMKTEHTSVKNGHKKQILSFSTRWVGLSQKPVSCSCPFMLIKAWKGGGVCWGRYMFL
jgi:hypothetical protein